MLQTSATLSALSILISNIFIEMGLFSSGTLVALGRRRSAVGANRSPRYAATVNPRARNVNEITREPNDFVPRF